jgi:adenylate cyclase
VQQLSRILKTPIASACLPILLVFLFVMILRHTGSLEFFELAAYDGCVALQPKISPARSRLVLVGITENDIRRQGKWPLSDAVLAELLKVLSLQNPRAIGVDIFRDLSVSPGQEDLDSTLVDNPNIIAVMKFGEGGIPGPPVLKNTEQLGFNDLLVDPGGIVRRGLLFLDDGETSAQAFALRLALLYLQKEGIRARADDSHPEYLRLGPQTVRPFEADDGPYVRADARGYQFLLDFKEDLKSFPLFSLTDLMTGKIVPGALTDKIVIVGTVAQDAKDFFYTPYSKRLDSDQNIPGIAIHAHIISQLLRWALGENGPIITANKTMEGAWIFLWCLLGGTLGFLVRSPWRFSLFAATGVGVLWVGTYFAFLSGFCITMVPPAMGWITSAIIVTAHISNQEKKQRASLMQIFSMHVSPSLAEVIWQQRDQFLSGGRPRSQKLVATILFADLKGFSPVAEELDPIKLTEWLNTYMDKMTQVVMENSGVVDDYAGDGIKADFGTPLARKNEDEIRKDAENAVRCALCMGEEMHRINTFWKEQGLPTAGLRIGVHTGLVVAGTFGSSKRLKYTTIGNSVNIASRLESYDREHADTGLTQDPFRILISEATKEYIGEQFVTRKIGDVRFKGQKRDITVYSVLDWNRENSLNPMKEPES